MTYFTPDELRCKGSGLVKLHPGFLDALNELRDRYGKPMVITSGCRSKAHNMQVGGHPRSLHICDIPSQPGQLGCLAVDVRVEDGVAAREFVFRALQQGWSIGVPKTGFIHVDRRDFIGLKPALFGY